MYTRIRYTAVQRVFRPRDKTNGRPSGRGGGGKNENLFANPIQMTRSNKKKKREANGKKMIIRNAVNKSRSARGVVRDVRRTSLSRAMYYNAD